MPFKFDLLEDLPHACFTKEMDFTQAETLERARDSLGLSHIVAAKQVHGTAIARVDETTKGRPECDALITSAKDVALCIRHADCQPAIFYNPIKKEVAAVHSGWRGSAANIYAHVISAMGSPENLLVCIGPSLGLKHAEFINYRNELPEHFWKHRKGNHFDFWEITRNQLEESGILPHHIEISGMCTREHPDLFFSYRRGDAGRLGTVVGIH